MSSSTIPAGQQESAVEALKSVKHIDWRELGAVNPVKDQVRQGSTRWRSIKFYVCGR